MIEVAGLLRRYGGSVAVADVSFRVERGELLVLVGDSGSGKTTTLKMINRLVEPDAGRVVIDGRDTRDARARTRCGADRLRVPGSGSSRT